MTEESHIMASTAKPKEEAPADFDDLLAEVPEKATTDSEPEPTEEILTVEGEPEEEIVEVELTPAQKRLAEAREAMRTLQQAPEPQVVTETVPVEDPYAGLSEDEIRELKAAEDFVASETARRVLAAPAAYDNSQRGGTGQKVLFHIVLDGFTAFGQVWLRGQEIEIEVGTPAYERTKNALGVSWLDLIEDRAGQYAKWGKEYIAPGAFIPRPNEKFDDEVAREDQRRNRSVPVLTV